MIKSTLELFITQHPSFSVSYLIGNNGPVNLKFHKTEINDKNNIILTNRIINDELFFKEIYKQYSIGKNDVLRYIHQNIDKNYTISLSNNLKFVLTTNSIYWFKN